MESKESSNGGGPSLSKVERWTGVNLRGHKRVPIRVPIECRAGKQAILGSAENIGLGGGLLRAGETLSWGEIVSLLFALPGSTETLQVNGRVAHVVPDAFMGLEFLELPLQARRRIEKYISSVVAVPHKRDEY